MPQQVDELPVVRAKRLRFVTEAIDEGRAQAQAETTPKVP